MVSVRDLVLSCISKSRILKWHVKAGELVRRDAVIATYVFTEKVADASNFIVQRKLKAKLDGRVVDLVVAVGDEILRGQVVARVSEETCEHETVMKDMCCDCGADLRIEGPGGGAGVGGGDGAPVSTAQVPVVHNILELKVSVKEAERLARYDEKQLLKARKLVLVVDLDMTLLHTTVEPVPNADAAKDVHSFRLPGHPFEYHTKLRPGAGKFLESVSKFYELHIFTMGSRMYAHTVAKFLDPKGQYFAHRIRSRDEFLNSFSKVHDLKALFPCGDHMVGIIDDREDVWNYAANLIAVKPYRFFTNTGDIHNPFTPESTSDVADSSSGDEKQANSDEKKSGDASPETSSVLTIAQKIAANEQSLGLVEANVSKKSQMVGTDNGTDLDDYLFYLDEILERIHFSFYHTLDEVKQHGGTAIEDASLACFCTNGTSSPDVRAIVPELRRKTLAGGNIVFTGVVPTNVPLEKSRAWRTAVSLGARVSSEITVRKQPDQPGFFTSHVIAARHGTQKAHKAYRLPSVRLVNPDWLWACSERWECAPEDEYPVPDIDGSRCLAQPGSASPRTPPGSDGESRERSHGKISPLAGPDLQSNEESVPVTTLSSFSKEVLDDMDKEVDELLSDDDDSDNDNEQSWTNSNPKSDGTSSISENGQTSDERTTTTDDASPPSSESNNVLHKLERLSEELGSVTKKRKKSHRSDHGEHKKKRRGSSSQEVLDTAIVEAGSEGTAGEATASIAEVVELVSSGEKEASSSDSDSDTSDSSDDSSSDTSSVSSGSDDAEDAGDSDDDEIGNMLERRISESHED